MALIVKAQIMDREAFERALIRIAHQIIEKNHGVDDVCLIGIKTRGVPLAKRLADNIKSIEGTDVPVGELDITLHRDDIDRTSAVQEIPLSEIPFPIKDKTVVLVDDVIFTCRTARAAMDAVMSMGRPAKVQFFAMIDRGHAELPIKANYVGKSIPTSKNEIVAVNLEEIDGVTNVIIMEEK